MSYKTLKSYQSATIIYDLTVMFCKTYKSYWSGLTYRTSDQMIQAARSGKQNIVEASTERTSKKSEIKLLGVARASFQELLEDFEDFLRQNSFALWKKDSREAREVRGLVYQSNWSYKSYQSYLSSPEKCANALICLIHQANYLLDRQILVLQDKFVKEGGFTEELFRKRLAYKTNRTYKSYQNKQNL